jgi:mRNA interferase MazF
VISRGDVFWLTFRGGGSEPAGRLPAVVIQHDRFNHTRLNTVIVAAVTSNLRLAQMPGNVRLAAGEANLPRASVINVTQVVTVDKSRLSELAGRLSSRKRAELVEGLRLVLGDDGPLH